jgi:AmmeMemoRadiSam system protein B
MDIGEYLPWRSSMDITTDIRPSPIAGRWYTSDPKKLAASIDAYINAAKLPPIEGEIIGVVAPHAGHMYSGPVAGYAFAAVRGLKPELVAVISPMHHPYYEPLLTTSHQAYGTPLGPLLIDQEAMGILNNHLSESLGFSLTPIRRDPEHSLEIELPFLQRAFESKFRLLPVMVRDQSARVTRALGQALAKALQGKPALLVASTDLSHFYTQEIAKTLDTEMLHKIETFDPQGVLDIEEQGKGFACGKGAVAAVLWAAKELGADKVQVLHHATSGDVTGDLSQVVGYGAAVITRKRSNN